MLYGGLRDATKICHPFGLELRPILQPRLSSPRRPPVPSKSFPEGGWWGGGVVVGLLSRGPGVKHNTQPVSLSFALSPRSLLALFFSPVRIPIWPRVALEY